MNPLISVVTICRNDYEGLKRTYRSVVAQDRSLFEWIVVDGASTDGTCDFLKILGSDLAHWSSEPDEGIYDAMNKGIAHSKAEYCIFMNAGDEFAADDILSKVSVTLRDQADLVYGDAIEVFEKGEAYKAAFPASRHWYSMFTHHQAVFYRRAKIADGYDVSFRLAADWALTSRLLNGGSRALYFPAPICRFHRGGASDSGKLRVVADRELWRIYREVHMHSLPKALALYLLKRAANAIRFSAKPLYETIRLKPVSSTKG